MKNLVRSKILFLALISAVYVMVSCEEKTKDDKGEVALHKAEAATPVKVSKKELSEDFKKYWYAGDAEITSYKLQQARYGEMRDGHSVLIYVTEPFLADKQVKADENHPDNIPVLKLNSTKKFLTGIYPYSIMSSSFYPVHDNQHALKISFSAQEWCGHVYSQLNNRDKFEIKSYSYFETEGDQTIKLEKKVLENELWNKIRISPKDLPVGSMEIIPSFEYIRLSHKELKPYSATVTLKTENEVSAYEITYPELERILEIKFTAAFPYTIESWTETFKSGFGENAKTMTSTATKINTLKRPYWKENGNNYLFLRDTLGL